MGQHPACCLSLPAAEMTKRIQPSWHPCPSVERLSEAFWAKQAAAVVSKEPSCAPYPAAAFPAEPEELLPGEKAAPNAQGRAEGLLLQTTWHHPAACVASSAAIPASREPPSSDCSLSWGAALWALPMASPAGIWPHLPRRRLLQHRFWHSPTHTVPRPGFHRTSGRLLCHQPLRDLAAGPPRRV